MAKDLTVRFSLLNEEVLNHRFENLEHVPDDFRPAFEKMAEDFWENNAKTFMDLGPDSSGKKWKALTFNTQMYKLLHFPGMPPMVRTGRLLNSLIDGTAPDAVYEVYSDHLVLGTDVKYAIYHQTGNLKVVYRGTKEYPPGTWPPKREVVVLHATLRKKWVSRIQRYLHDEVGYGGQS